MKDFVQKIKDALQKWWNTGGGTTVKVTMEGSKGGSGGRLNAKGGIYANGSWSNIPQYATGGLPNHGSMFVAGEAGAEIVGHIGGRTEVLNQSQIASAIYSAVVSAMSQSGSQGVEVYLHTDEGVIVDRINQKTRQTGKSQIYIPY